MSRPSDNDVSAGSDTVDARAEPRVPEPAAQAAVPERIGRYRVTREVGAGGMGAVYAAHDPDLDRVVAIKLLRPSLHAKGAMAFRARLAREAQAMARLAHPNVIAVHDIGSVGDQLFIAMELIDGGTLTWWLRDRPRGWREVTEVMRAAGRGLAAAHAAGVIHRDFKPDNVLVGRDGRVRVTDFGVAYIAPAEAEPAASEATDPGAEAAATTLTRPGVMVGTPAYMSPEQLRGEAADERSDLFGFCATFWEALYGERPFAGRTLEELRDAVCAGELRPPPEGREAPDGLREAIRRGLAAAPAARWPSMEELLAAVETVARPAAPRRVRPWVAAALAVATLGAGTTAAVVALRGRREVASTTAPARRPVLAILGVTDEATGRRDGSLSLLLSERLAVELGAGGAVRLVPADEMRGAVQSAGIAAIGRPSREQLARLRETLGCDFVLLGLHRAGPDGELRLSVEIDDAASGRAAARVEDSGAAESLNDAAAHAALELRRKLALRDAPADELAVARQAFPAQPEAARLYAEGRAALASFEGGRARRAFERALELEPDQPLLYEGLASAWKMLEFDQREAEAARRAFELSSGLPREQKLRIEAKYREAVKDWGRAAQIWSALATFFPDDLGYGLRLFEDLARAGRRDDAVAELARLRRLPPPDGDSPRIDLAESGLAGRRGEGERALELAQRAAAAGEARGERRVVARANIQLCIQLENQKLDDALAACGKATRLFEEAGDQANVAQMLALTAALLSRAQRFDEARELLGRALSIYDEIGSRLGVARVTEELARIWAAGPGDMPRSIAGYREALAIYREVNERDGEALTLGNLAASLTEAGQLEEAEATYHEAIELTHELEMQDLEATARSNLSYLLVRRGHVAEAVGESEGAVAVFRSVGSKGDLAYALEQLGRTYLRAARLAEARTALDESLAIRGELGWVVGPSRKLLAELSMAEGDLGAAESLARQAVEELRDKQMALDEIYAIEVHARVLLRRGDDDALQAASARALALGKQLGLDETSEYLAMTLAQARASRGDVAGAIADVERAVARSEKLGLVEDGLDQRMVLARLLIARGPKSRARAVLAALRRDAASHGFAQMVREVDALAGGE